MNINILFNLYKNSLNQYYLKKIEKDSIRYSNSINRAKKIKILFGPSFSIYPPCFVHDKILASALRIRGAKIMPVYCDAIQKIECNVYGGVWEGKSFQKSCLYCVKQSQILWENNDDLPIKLSKYISLKEKAIIEKLIKGLDSDKWTNFVFDDLPFGSWAKDILVNNYVVGDYRLIPDYLRLGLVHIENLLLLRYAYKRILNLIKPDRVISNDSFYGMWAMMQILCERKQIPFYSNWIGGRKNAWCYAYNDAAMNLDFSKPWKKFSKIALNKKNFIKVQRWLKGRTKGREMILDTASLAKYKTEEFNPSNIDPKKPTALLASNVIWDLAALNKQILFSDMMDWIIQTIKWFGTHPQFQLIVKPHPAELHPSIPATKENVIDVLKRKKIKIPQNVIILTPKTKVTVYQLFPIATIGLVHTTTVGIEMAASGIPVITTGRSPYHGFGFTIDPKNRNEYFQNLRFCLMDKRKIMTQRQLNLAYKFILFYNFHYYTKIDIMNNDQSALVGLKVKSINDFLPGKNKYLDYITDSIISGLPIVSENRWPPES